MINNQPDLEFITINGKQLKCNDFLYSIVLENICDRDDFIYDIKKIFLIDEDKLPDYIWNMSKNQCLIILDVLKKIKNLTLTLANDISRFYVHSGYSGVIELSNKNKNLYKVNFIENNEPFINSKEGVVGETLVSLQEKLIDYEGKVYCIEMSSSHLYYMRENNFAPSMLIGNSRAGQKGTIGLIIPEEDMPFTADGTRPDLIINPHASPSRMTIGQITEMLFGKVCASYGAFGDCTAFQIKGANYTTYAPLLVKAGFNSTGNQVLYNGMTGEQLAADIYVGPTYYMRLKHMVKDKINFRARGPNTMLTRQPVQGRANDGGLRVGEMERDGICAHGMAYFLNESFMVRGDEYYVAVCNKTGAISIYNEAKNLFLSPYADGPIEFFTNPDGTQNIRNLSRFGRSFSILRVPYSLKLLIQELQVMNVQMRIITDENADQLLSMSYSNNINKLLKSNEPAESLLKNAWRDLSQELKQNKPRANVYESPLLPEPAVLGETPSIPTPINFYEEGTPVESPQYAPGSTPSDYVPQSSVFNPESPQYAPGSPELNPESPAFASESPAEETIPYTPIVQEFGKDQTILEVEEPPTEENNTEVESGSASSEVKTIVGSESSESNSSETRKITL
jgi:hypothetical protein